MTENDVLFALVVGEVVVRLVKAGLSYRAGQKTAERKADAAKGNAGLEAIQAVSK